MGGFWSTIGDFIHILYFNRCEVVLVAIFGDATACDMTCALCYSNTAMDDVVIFDSPPQTHKQIHTIASFIGS
jgi:hypothetical protein